MGLDLNQKSFSIFDESNCQNDCSPPKKEYNQIAILMFRIEDLIVQEKEAKTIFEMGGFSKAMIVPTPMGAGFHLHLIRFGKGGTEVVERQRGGWRVFSSMDAAANTAHGIGFRRIEIDLSNR